VAMTFFIDPILLSERLDPIKTKRNGRTALVTRLKIIILKNLFFIFNSLIIVDILISEKRVTF
jgi:hypothetical protein